MDLQLTGRRALVTGRSVGIGETIAKGLAAEGVFVAIHGRDEDRAESANRRTMRLHFSTPFTNNNRNSDQNTAEEYH
jgi:NAD(P)-dependent dehydrogenase (short-subunit alcohol dehydrogenase family)